MLKYTRDLLRQYLPISLLCRIDTFRSKGTLKIGRRSYVHPTVQILGLSNVSIGDNTCIGEHSWLNVNHRNDKQTAIDIGSNCFVGRGNFFSSGNKISIGDYCLTTIGCKFICSTHFIDNPLLPYITTGTTSDESIRVGPNCFFGSGSTVLGNITIGHGSVIGANAVVLKDVPAFSIVVGNPAKIVRRYSFSKQLWCKSTSITEEDICENPDEQTYLEILRREHPTVAMPWIAAGANLGNL